MANYTYRDVVPTLIENTTMQVKIKDGVDYQYTIVPNVGYVLHDNTYDTLEHNEDMTEVINTIPGYRRSMATCAFAYDFTVNPREFYAVLESEVDENYIFGGTDPKPEVQ